MTPTPQARVRRTVSQCQPAKPTGEEQVLFQYMDCGYGRGVDKVEGGRRVEMVAGGTEPTPLRHGCITIVAVAFGFGTPIGTLCDLTRRVVAVTEIPGTGGEDADADADAYCDDPAILLLIRGAAPMSGQP